MSPLRGVGGVSLPLPPLPPAPKRLWSLPTLAHLSSKLLPRHFSSGTISLNMAVFFTFSNQLVAGGKPPHPRGAFPTILVHQTWCNTSGVTSPLGGGSLLPSLPLYIQHQWSSPALAFSSSKLPPAIFSTWYHGNVIIFQSGFFSARSRGIFYLPLNLRW